MSTSGRFRPRPVTALSRRRFLWLTGASLLVVAGCGDAADDRRFAGEPGTDLPRNDLPQTETPAVASGSPTALPTSMPVAQLLGIRSESNTVLAARPHDVTAIDVETGEAWTVWSDPARLLWAFDLAPDGSKIALMTSVADTAGDLSLTFVNLDDGGSKTVGLGARFGTPSAQPDAVAGGTGGVAWLPDSASVAVALPTGGLVQVFPDGSQVRLLPSGSARRPGAVSISAEDGALAFVDQQQGDTGSGIYAGSMKAKPIDPVVLVPGDRSGNRYARDVQWVPPGGRVATIIDREELGSPQGDLFFIDAHTAVPELIWTSPRGRDTSSVRSFSVSPDGGVIAFVTSPVGDGAKSASALWVMQVDGPAIERFDLPVVLDETSVWFTSQGIAVTGVEGKSDGEPGMVHAYVLAPGGKLTASYVEQLPASPVASPVASPQASPVASPVASPSPVPATPSA